LVFSIRPDVVGRSEGIENFGSGFGGFRAGRELRLDASAVNGTRSVLSDRSAVPVALKVSRR